MKTGMSYRSRNISWAGLACLALALGGLPMIAGARQARVALGSASSFGVLAASTVTSTGGATVDGDLGVSPGTALTGSPAVSGETHLGDAVAAQAQLDLTVAYNDAAGRSVAPISVAGNIGGQTLAPGLYRSTSSLAISSGDLTLDAQGDANAVWVFQVASTLVTTDGRQVILSGGARAANVFWQVGSSATLGGSSIFKGTILADQTITMTTLATLDGRALARNGGVTMDGNTTVVPDADLRVAYDFDNDDVADVTVNHRDAGDWYIQQSGLANALRRQNWGWDDTLAVPADYDGDTIADIAVYLPETGTWYVRQSSNGQLLQQQWGWSAVLPVPGDYDGDGAADLAVYDPGRDTWHIRQSSNGALRQQQWGYGTTVPVPGDYDGDRITDLAVFHPTTADWYVLRSSDGRICHRQWGWAGVTPAPADYDGDGKYDQTVYDRSTGMWYICQSFNGVRRDQQWGWKAARPIILQTLINSRLPSF
jgi:hypothetical protein